jgi:hypothetical protein
MPSYPNVVVKLILPAELLATLAFMAAAVDAKTISPQLLALETHTAN